MRFSVIVPNLNEEKNLPMFLNSLVHQTFQDFQVIIIDGFSTDRSLQIIKSYKHKLKICVILDRKRNFGHLRNRGAQAAEGEIQFHGSSDTYLEPQFLEKLHNFYRKHPQVVSVAGRTYPIGTSVIAHLAYQAFDFLRFLFTCLPFPAKKYRPSGNFTSYRNYAWKQVGGYDEVPVNEDGIMGGKLERYAAKDGKKVVFRLNMWVGHHVKRFEEMGGIRAVLFYAYTLGNLFPMFKPLLRNIEAKAGKVFEKGR